MSDQIASIIYLKDKVHKWKNIAMILAFISLILVFGADFGGSSVDLVDSDFIAKVKIEGEIFEDEKRSEVLKNLSENKYAKAIVFEINSPGGGIVASEILFQEMRKIAEKKPTVVVMNSLAASGGYMAAIASDYIIAHNGTLTGSIGVLMESPEISELAKKVGVGFNSYKSSPLKGSPSLYEKASPQVNQAINESISDSYAFFVDLVKSRRGEKIKPENAKIVFDGRVFTGRQALNYGLVDEVGNFDSALNYLLKKGIDSKKVPLREVKVVDEKETYLEKFVGKLPWLRSFNSQSSQQNQIKAVFN